MKKIIIIAACVVALLAAAALIYFAASGSDDEGDLCEHVEVTLPALAATCTKTGLTEGKKCELCEEILVAQKSTSTVAHNYVDDICSMCGGKQPASGEDTGKDTTGNDENKEPTAVEPFIFTDLGDGSYSVKANNAATLPQKLVIPSSYNNKAVTVIENSAFKDCVGITSITIPESIKKINKSAFEGCTALTEILFNATDCSALEMENKAFYNAGKSGDGIKVTVGANVKRIPDCLFYSKVGERNGSTASPKITSVEFEANSACEIIGSHAFFDCNQLVSIKIPDSVKEIDNGAFYACFALKELTIGGGVETIDNSAFGGCRGLKSLTIPAKVKLIVYNAFAGCEGLTELKYNATECELWEGGDAFADLGLYSGGVNVIIGANVKKIPANLFNCKAMSGEAPKLLSVKFEDGSVCESIGDSAFVNCAKLKDVYFPGSADQWAHITVGANNDPIKNATIHYNSK